MTTRKQPAKYVITPTTSGRFYVVHLANKEPTINDEAFTTVDEAEERRDVLNSGERPKELDLPDLEAAMGKAFNGGG